MSQRFHPAVLLQSKHAQEAQNRTDTGANSSSRVGCATSRHSRSSARAPTRTGTGTQRGTLHRHSTAIRRDWETRRGSHDRSNSRCGGLKRDRRGGRSVDGARVQDGQEAHDVRGERFQPSRRVSGREGRGHFGGEGGGAGERVADGVGGDGGREDHEDRALHIGAGCSSVLVGGSMGESA